MSIYSQDQTTFASTSISESSTLQHITPNLQTAEALDVSPKGYIDLHILKDTAPYTAYKFSLTLDVTPILPNGSLDTANTYNVVLDVENNYSAGSGNFIDAKKHILEGSYGVSVTIQSYVFEENGTPITNGAVPANISLTLGYSTTRYYELPLAAPEIQSHTTTGGKLQINWSSVAEANSYDVEWTWVDRYGNDLENPQLLLNPEDISFSRIDFKRNSTRVQVPAEQNTYSIPLVYSKGYIIYRVRAVGHFLADISKPKHGNWSVNPAPDNNGNTTVQHWQNGQPDKNVFEIAEEHENMNWQFQASYAEEGKKKEVVSYFDGSLRNRQTVTTINSDDNAIVGEVIYDAQGRPAVEVLPVPTNNNELKYYTKFNTDATGAPYNYSNFDLNSQNQQDVTSADKKMNASSKGASYYYSSNNTIANLYKDQIPNAEELPFSQIEYTPDNTGRIRRKSGVGKAHQLGSGHEMEYYYGTPEQKELNRLFGYSVGNALRYKKNMVLDPNGQLSVSYIDPQGRTIATALAGDAPKDANGNLILDVLDDEADTDLHDKITSDLLNKTTSLDVDTPMDNNAIGSTGNFGNLNDQLTYIGTKTVVFDGPRTFNYNITNIAEPFTYGCVTNHEFPFEYALKIDVLNANGESLLNGGTPFVDTFNLGTGATHNTYTLDPEIIINNVKRGTISVAKTLTVNKAKVEEYADAYIAKLEDPNNTACYVPESSLIEPLEFEGCYETCEECENAFKAKYPTPQDFVTDQIALLDSDPNYFDSLPQEEQDAIEASFLTQYDDVIIACNEPCNDGTLPASPTEEDLLASFSCENILDLLKMDMSPLGQYAGNQIDNLETLPLSIFNTNNVLLSTLTGDDSHNSWKNPRHFTLDGANTPAQQYTSGHYYNEDGSISKIKVIQQADGSYLPAIDENISIIPAEDVEISNAYWVEPQYLANAKDFMSSDIWQDSWAESLIVYHPEYAYLEYTREVCKLTTGNFNSDGFDKHLQGITTFADAISAGYMGSAAQMSIFNADPYFNQIQDVTFETPALFSAREDMMQIALSSNYNNTGKEMIISAYANVKYNSLEDTSLATFITNASVNISGILDGTALTTPEEKDRLWNTYKSDYLALKQRIQTLFANVYAQTQGGYNGCVGSTTAPDNLTDVLAYFPEYNTVVSAINTYLNSNPSGIIPLCDYEHVLEYANKQKHFIPSDFFYNAAASPEDAAEDIAEQANYDYFLGTGVCPLARDLMVYLEGYLKERSLAGNIAGQPYESQYLSRKLFEELGGTGTSATINADKAGALLTLSLNSIGSASHITVNMPGYNWDNYGGTWDVISISTIKADYNAAGQNFTYQALAKLNVGGNYEEVVINGATTARIAACSISDPLAGGIGEYLGNGSTWNETGDCNIEVYFTKAIISLLNELIATDQVNSTAGVAISDLGDYTNGYLPEFFGGQEAIWTYETGNIYSITVDGNLKMEMILDKQIPTNVAINHIDYKYLYNADQTGINAQNIKISWQGDVAEGTVVENEERLINFSCCDDINNYYDYIPPVCSLAPQFGSEMVTLINATIQSGSMFSTNLNKNIALTSYSEYTTFLQSYLTQNSAYVADTYQQYNTSGVDFSNLDHVSIGVTHWSSHTYIIVSFSDIYRMQFYIQDQIVASSPTFQTIIHQSGNNFILTYLDDQGIEKSSVCQFFMYNKNIKDLNPFGTYLYFDCDIESTYQNATLQGDPDDLDNNDLNSCGNIQEDALENSLVDAFNAHLEYNRSEISENERNTRFDNLFFNQFNLNERFRSLLEPYYAENHPGVSYNNNFVFYQGYISPSSNVQPNVDLFSIGGGALGIEARFENSGELQCFLYFENDFYDVKEILDIKIIRSSYGIIATVDYKDLSDVVKTGKNIMMRIHRTDYSPNTSNNLIGSNLNLCDILSVDVNQSLAAKSSGTKQQVDTSYFSRVQQVDENENLTLSSSSSSNALALGATCNTPCPPVPVVPISATEKYPIFLGILDDLGIPKDAEGTYAEQDYSEEEFRDMQLAYIVDDYDYYLTQLGIKAIAIPEDRTYSLQYITIAEFGATEYGYGYQNMAAVIDAYVQHVTDNAATPEDTQSWTTFTEYRFAVDKANATSSGGCMGLPGPLPISTGNITVDPPENGTCKQFAINVHNTYLRDSREAFLKRERAAFIEAYLEDATKKAVENFSMEYDDKEYQYTLYYYDQAGNLIQTVPPEGVDRFTKQELNNIEGGGLTLNDEINTHRNTNNSTEVERLLPSHRLKTEYRYNSLNQLVWQSTPDGGITRFAYDDLGRIVASQNDNQVDNNAFSYTVYDKLGRIIEAGELVPNNVSLAINTTTGKLINTGTGEVITTDGFPEEPAIGFPKNISLQQNEVTNTVYSTPVSNAISVFNTVTNDDDAINNSRNRVTAVYYYDQKLEATNLLDFNNAIYYNYDIHGNVKELVQHNRLLALTTDAYAGLKRIEYEYDLISGNVNKVYYQKGEMDQFIHKYEYDADNRIINVQTSSDGFNWETDASYDYFNHGPLARTVLGDKKVQGQDYVYTLQGWLKGVNADVLDPAKDLGKDGNAGSTVAKDAYGYQLNYYSNDPEGNNDYAAIGSISAFTNTTAQSNIRNLYNGNIKQMATAIADINETALSTQVNNYTYDQLNRIKSMQGYDASGNANYNSTYEYDRNGNLKTLTREAVNSSGVLTPMDNFDYKYNEISDENGNTQIVNNRLRSVQEVSNALDGNFDTDIDFEQALDNYEYDKIGQLTRDIAEKIDNIEWRVDGKVASITKDGGAQTIKFTYDGLGNRIAKTVLPDNITTVYSRDAQGNVMAVYETNEADITNISANKAVILKEHHIYGSSRLGIEQKNLQGSFNVSIQSGIITGTKLIQAQDNINVGGASYTVEPGANLTLKAGHSIVLKPGTTIKSGSTLLATIEAYSATTEAPNTYAVTIGDKRYELSNHLGNVLSVISDRKLVADPLNFTNFTADVLSYNDYYPFGMLLPNRHGSSDNYRYGFGSQEKDDEIKGNGNSYNFGARMYDPRVGRWFAMDKYEEYFPHMSPYAYSLNSPLLFTDKNGDFPWLPFVKGAVIAAFSDMTFQMIDYMILNRDFDFKAALGNVDWTDVSVEAGKGGALEYFTWGSYTANRVSKLFKGRYRAYTFYLIKESIVIVQDLVTDVAKDYLNGNDVDVVNILTRVLGNKLVGEIMSSTPLIPKAMKKTGKKITKKLDKAVRLERKVKKLRKEVNKAIKNGKKKKAQRLIETIHKKAKKIDKLESQATNMLAGEYANGGWTETFKGEFTSRAKQTVKKYVEKRVKTGFVSVGDLFMEGEEGYVPIPEDKE